ncbi:MAG: nucleotide sugar dehydrogenase [Planctomycetota bacterium]
MQTSAFIKKINDRSATIGVVGLGYVGLPLLMAFSRKGFRTLGFDIDKEKCKRLMRGESYIKHIPAAAVKALRNFEAVTDFDRVGEADAVIICVPTPLTPNMDPDMTYIVNTVEGIGPHLRKGQLISLESTTYPGTTDEIVVPGLEQHSGLKAGRDFWVSFSPEREDPVNKKYSTTTIPKVVGGHTAACMAVAAAVYGAVIETIVPVSDTRTAEAVKLMENIFRGVNIALVNELKIIFDRMGIDIWEVVNAAKTKPFGFMPFYPGPGLGGHCIPIDPFYLAWKAKEFGVRARFIELAGEVNQGMPEYVLHKTMEGLNRARKPMTGARILIVGMAYKPDVDDMRESPSLELLTLFRENGATVDYHDPFIAALPATRKHPDLAGQRSVPLARAGSYDCVVVSTAHSGIDYAGMVKRAKLVVDTRNACPRGPKVIRA